MEDVARLRQVENSSDLRTHRALANGFLEAVASAMNNTAIVAQIHKHAAAVNVQNPAAYYRNRTLLSP